MKSKIQQALDNNKPYGRSWEDFLLPDQMEFLYKAFEQFASQPPSGNLWEEVDAVKEPPGERDTVYEDVSVDCMIIFEDGTCKIGYYDYAAKEWRHYTKYNDTVSVGVKSYLRPVTWQRYSEEEMGKAIDLIRDALPYSGYDSPYRKRAEQFIQSLNKK